MSEKKIESRRAFFKNAGKLVGAVALAAPICVATSQKAEAATCPTCKGTGQSSQKCIYCDNGIVKGTKTTKCTACRGTGWKPCATCQGTGKK